jgi:micrococcal nuclease
MKKLLLLLVFVVGCGTTLQPRVPKYDSPEWHPATVQYVVDGDTFDFIVNVGWEMLLQTRTRLNAFDTPEMRGEDKLRGIEARDFVVAWFEACNNTLLVKQYGKGKYGRWIVDVQCAETKEDLAEALRKAGLHK